MAEQLCIFCCHNFADEFSAAAIALGCSDVVIAPFPARCGHPALGWEELRSKLPSECTRVIVLGSACLRGLGTPPADFPTTRVVGVDQCFHLIAGETLVNEALLQGAYLLTPGWLAEWRVHLLEMGFDLPQGGDYFREFAQKLLLLDTGLDPETPSHWTELKAVINLPAERIPVGLDHVRLLLGGLIQEWRLEQQQKANNEANRIHAKELADHVAAMDMLQGLAKTQLEDDAIKAIDELFRMLFAPAALHYLRVESGVMTPASPTPDAQLTELYSLTDHYAWSADGQGFLVRISHGNEVLGLVSVAGLAYPQYRIRYLNTALAISGVCGLAISNARNRKRLIEAEKMASLGVLVAGVAHEINTPLGVGLAATSTIQMQTRELAGRFAERRMTQSDLQHYLDTATSSTDLLRRNLERIGRLIDSFRQVAVSGKAPESSRFRLKDQLTDVVHSLGDQLDPRRVELRIDCNPNLEIRGHPDDWSCIFTNLISNSVAHGFRERPYGHIDISIADHHGLLTIDYRDDGSGASADIQARIFDPFFTTDMQKGMGLGLYLVYNLVTHRLGGSIQCDCAPGRGMHFHITLPITPGP